MDCGGQAKRIEKKRIDKNSLFKQSLCGPAVFVMAFAIPICGLDNIQ